MLADGARSGRRAGPRRQDGGPRPPMTAPMSARRGPRRAGRRSPGPSPDASNGIGTAPSKSEPRPTCSAPATSHGVGDRAGDRRRRRRRQQAVGQNPIPTMPPVAAIPRSWSSVRLRALSATAADAGVRGDDRPGRRSPGRRRSSRPTRGRRRRASAAAPARSTSSRPAAGQPALRDAVGGAGERVVEEMGRARPSGSRRVERRVELAGSSSSAWAPSIASRPGDEGRIVRATGAERVEVGRGRMTVKRPSERPPSRGPARPGGAPAASRLRHVARRPARGRARAG